ncbi:MAG: glycosyltransferase [Candidatus Aminicenantes bacterium]|nr:glycosyltransferase [Candidatus Aminicenantes bacterium]MCK5003785.1 glycosyltransferase [Candidatus Aminicenantes bacterium]
MKEKSENKEKLLLLSNVFNPYRIPVFTEIAKKYDLKVVWVQKQVKFNPWEFTLSDPNFEYRSRLGNIFSFIKDLKQYKVIVFGGYAPLKLLMLLFLVKLMRKKTVMWYGLKNNEVYPDGLLRILKKKLVHMIPDVFVTYGSYITEYIKKRFNVRGEDIVTAVNVGQVEYFRSQMLKSIKESGQEQKKQINLITVSRLIKKKGVLLLIEAVSELEEKDFKLLIVGTGPQMATLKKKIVALGIQNKVEITGFVSRSELTRYYQDSDIFILPTLTDPFSISSSEAISSGLFSLISKFDNASYDLVKSGINGFVFDPLDKKNFKMVLTEALNLYRSGKINKEDISSSIKDFSEQFYASKVIEAINKVI